MRVRSIYEKDKIKEYYYKKIKTENIINKYKQKRNNSIIDKILDNINRRTRYALEINNVKLQITYSKLLGCNKEENKDYLQSLFVENMNFSNYGDWEIDHIKPISLYKLNNETELLECFNYKNTQPLWKVENRIKSNNYVMKS